MGGDPTVRVSGNISCLECRKVHNVFGKSAPCGECYPGIHPWNEAAFALYNLCDGQWRMGFNGAIAIDLIAIESAMRICQIPAENRADLANDVLHIGQIILKNITQKEEA